MAFCKATRSASKSSGVVVGLTLCGRLISTRTLANGRGTMNRSQLPSREKNDARPKFIPRAARTVRSDHDIATGRQHLRQLENRGRAQPRTRTANYIVAETLNGVGQQIAVAAGADQCSAMPLRKKTAQDQWEDQQSIVPERADVILRDRSADHTRAVVDFITQRTSPELQQTKSKRDQPSRKPAFDLQLFFRELLGEALSCPQR